MQRNGLEKKGLDLERIGKSIERKLAEAEVQD